MIENSAEENKNKENFDVGFTDEDIVKIRQFCRINRIQPVSEALAEFVSLLDWHTQKKKPDVQETAIYNALLRLEKTVHKSSTWEIMGSTTQDNEEGPLTNISDFEMNVMEQTTSTFIKDLLDEENSDILFFPLTNFREPSVIVKWRILEKLASVKITAENTIYKQKLSECLKNRIRNEVENWLHLEFEILNLSGRKSILEDIKTLTEIIKNLLDQLNKATSTLRQNDTLFFETDISYIEAVALALDNKLYPLCQKIMESMDEYQTSHKDFHVNIRDSCALSHAFYRQLKKLVNILKDEDEKTLCSDLNEYSKLFQGCFLNLLYVLKSECHFRIKRAVEDESKDSILTEERILSSSVIILNCFCTVMDEWKQLEIVDEELKTAFLIKITDIICDGAKILAEALECRLKQSGGGHLKSTEQTKKACVLANSIQNVQLYLQNLPEQMHWAESLNGLNVDQSNSNLKQQILRILNLIYSSMDSHLNDIVDQIIKVVVAYVQHRCEKHLVSWLNAPVGSQHVDRLLHFLNDEMEFFYKCWKDDLFPIFLNQLWISFMTFIKNNFQEGLPPEYASAIGQSLEELQSFFLFLKMENSDPAKALHEQINEMLTLSSKSTVELQLDYYTQLAELMISPLEYLGHIAFQAGYKSTDNGLVDIYINVQKGQRLPIRKFEMSELHLKVELCPNTIFPSQLPLKSTPIPASMENPVFNEFFKFCKLPIDLLSVRGAVVQVLVLNNDRSYSAEAVLQLNRVQNLSGVTSIEFLPVYLMPLRKFDMSHISFQVLVSRSRWDRNAKLFITKRNKSARTPRKFLRCLPVKSVMCNFASNND